MKKAIVAKKLGMTQIFTPTGLVVPVTVLEAGPCVVVQKKTMEKDGYEALQLGFGEIKDKHVNRPSRARFERAGIAPKKVLREFRLENISDYETGAEIKADIFTAGDRVDVSGISKGKGYQGAIKRHGQSRGPMSHGSKYHRGLGSMGAATSPGKVPKNKKMPGHMGCVKVTVQNLEVVRADADKNVLLIKGSVPGPKGTVLVVKESVKA